MTHTLGVIDHAENRNDQQPASEESDLNDPIVHGDLLDATHSYARAAQAADEAIEAAQTSATALVNSDIEAIEAFNIECEAKAAHNRGSRNEAGFTAEVKSRGTGDLDLLNHAKEMASLRYQQCRHLGSTVEDLQVARGPRLDLCRKPGLIPGALSEGRLGLPFDIDRIERFDVTEHKSGGAALDRLGCLAGCLNGPRIAVGHFDQVAVCTPVIQI